LGAAHEGEQIRHITSTSGTTPVTNLSIPQAATLMAQADVVVSNDSGLMHLAAGLNTPLVALFGPTVAEFGFYPFRTQAIVHDHILKCRPCSAHGGSECPQRHFRCMKDTLPDNVFQSVISLLNRPV
jgi:heptosyltransferase-2